MRSASLILFCELKMFSIVKTSEKNVELTFLRVIDIVRFGSNAKGFGGSGGGGGEPSI
jgi:nanoRNase/pAp phosphatase (c-di-AMP/oligoRNAs hydrolase)